jgi:hypothetical protein
MNEVRRWQGLSLALLLAACSSQPAKQQAADAEIAAMMPLKRHYSDIVMGFDIRPQTTLIVSVDLQQYILTDDDTPASTRRIARALHRLRRR